MLRPSVHPIDNRPATGPLALSGSRPGDTTLADHDLARRPAPRTPVEQSAQDDEVFDLIYGRSQ